MMFLLTFLTSTWYIKNPFLKNKLIDVSLIANDFIACLMNLIGIILCKRFVLQRRGQSPWKRIE
jgi:hypothetical protein